MTLLIVTARTQKEFEKEAYEMAIRSARENLSYVIDASLQYDDELEGERKKLDYPMHLPYETALEFWKKAKTGEGQVQRRFKKAVDCAKLEYLGETVYDLKTAAEQLGFDAGKISFPEFDIKCKALGMNWDCLE